MKARRYSDADLAPIIDGKVALPNAEDRDALLFLCNLAAVGHGWAPKWGYALIDGRRKWTYFFLKPDAGEGYAVVYGPSYPKPAPRVMRFAICKHEKVSTGTREAASRGWHPGHCKHCGMDMSIDSGD